VLKCLRVDAGGPRCQPLTLDRTVCPYTPCPN
jgi:hypothetical protein